MTRKISTTSLGIATSVINILMAVAKIITGILGNSFVLIADGIESIGDIFSSAVTWIGFHFSQKPPDENHPYGHGRFESMAGLFSGITLLTAAGWIAWQSVLEIIHPNHSPEWFTLPILIIIILIKISLSRQVLAAGETLKSAALKSEGWHHQADAITSASAVIGISIALIGGKGYENADDWAALVACAIIITNASRILSTAIYDLSDGKLSDNITQKYRNLCLTVSGVEGIEKCKVRKSGLDLFVEIHVLVDGNIKVSKGHLIGHAVKDKLMQSHSQIRDVVVHIEPENTIPNN